MLLTDTVIRKAKATDKAYRLSDGARLVTSANRAMLSSYVRTVSTTRNQARLDYTTESTLWELTGGFRTSLVEDWVGSIGDHLGVQGGAAEA
jgi:hypothetical protein